MRIRALSSIDEAEGKTASFAFGRMNPPTIGHKKLADAVLAQAGDPYIFLSQSQKPQTDPLDFVTKLALARKFFPGVSVGDPSVKTIIQALTKLDSLGYDNVIYVAGSDRIQDFIELLNKYNGTPDKSGNIAYTFKNIQVVSAGERDPDAEGAEGMSASKMRAAAAEGDFEAFKSGTPEPKLAQTMYDRVRAGMGITEEAPPGREKQVKALKGKVDNPYAVAWASYNKSKKVIETLQDLHRAKPLDEATTQYVLKQVSIIKEQLNNINEAYSPEIDDKWMEKEIRANAKKHGIDPNVAVRVWRSEGGSSKNYQSKIKRDGKGSDGGREASYGPYQLYTGGGLGNEYQEKYGVDLSADNSPEGLSRQIDFALGKAKKVGWKPWYGAAKAGIGDRDGIDGTQYADAGNIATDASVDNSGPSDFGAAFASARKKQGGAGGKIKYQGKEYQTNVKGEKYVTTPVSVDEASGIDFETFQKQYAILNKTLDQASANIRSMSKDAKGPMGLVDPKVKNSPEFKKAQLDYNKASNATKAFLKGIPTEFLKRNARRHRNKDTNEATLDLPDLESGDELMVGKFKNRKATIKDFKKDEHGQPVAVTNKGDQKIFKGRVKKLMPTEGKSPHKKGTEKYRKHMAAMHASAEPKGTMIEDVSYANPQFDVEWEEANRYPYLEKLGPKGWEELAKTGRAVRVTTDSVKKIGNTGADGSESLDDLEPDKVARLKQAMDSGTVEMPIVVKQLDGSLELIAGNTRLIGLISIQGEAQVWLVDASTLAEGVGRIVKGVNTTPDVGINQTKIEAAKLGSKVDKDGRPPVLERGSIGVPLSSGLTVNVAPHRELKIKKSTKGRLNYENPRTNRQPKSKRGATI
jgi:hypothetical protein